MAPFSVPTGDLILCVTAHQRKTDYMQRLSAHRTSTSTEGPKRQEIMLLKKGGSSFQLEKKLQDGLDTADSLTCLLSGFTEHDWKIYMDTGVIQLNDSLRC